MKKPLSRTSYFYLYLFFLSTCISVPATPASSDDSKVRLCYNGTYQWVYISEIAETDLTGLYYSEHCSFCINSQTDLDDNLKVSHIFVFITSNKQQAYPTVQSIELSTHFPKQASRAPPQFT